MVKHEIKNMGRSPLNDVVGNPSAHLLKSGSALRELSQMKAYSKFSSKLPKSFDGVPLVFDKWWDLKDVKHPRSGEYYIDGFPYTDLMQTCLLLRAPNSKLNYQLLHAILENPDSKIDREVERLILEGLEDKYALTESTDTYPVVLFLPGSNILDTVLHKGKVKKFVEQDGAVIKPHPITTKFHVKLLKHLYGNEAVLDPELSGFQLMSGANTIGCCKNSELGLISILHKKPLLLLDKDEGNHSTYTTLYDVITAHKTGRARENLLKILTSNYSGFICVKDPKALDKVYNFLNSYNLFIKVGRRC